MISRIAPMMTRIDSWPGMVFHQFVGRRGGWDSGVGMGMMVGHRARFRVPAGSGTGRGEVIGDAVQVEKAMAVGVRQ
jgi:hypothetical protein